MQENQSIKKRIMFSKGDDFYFLSYNILLILYELGCFCGKRDFKDYRKLAFLIDFISNRSLALTVQRSPSVLNSLDRELFTRAYSNGLLRLNQIIRLLYTLEKKGLVTLNRELGRDIVNVCLVKEKIDTSFFDKELFRFEMNNIALLNKTIQRSTMLTLEKLLGRLFDNYGIKTWAES